MTKRDACPCPTTGDRSMVENAVIREQAGANATAGGAAGADAAPAPALPESAEDDGGAEQTGAADAALADAEAATAPPPDDGDGPVVDAGSGPGGTNGTSAGAGVAGAAGLRAEEVEAEEEAAALALRRKRQDEAANAQADGEAEAFLNQGGAAGSDATEEDVATEPGGAAAAGVVDLEAADQAPAEVVTDDEGTAAGPAPGPFRFDIPEPEDARQLREQVQLVHALPNAPDSGGDGDMFAYRCS